MLGLQMYVAGAIPGKSLISRTTEQSTRNLLVLNIGMEEIKFVEHKINLPTVTAVVVTE